MVVDVGIGRVIRDHQARINSVDFSKDGELLLSSGDDQHVYIYSCQHGTQVQTSQCRKYGVESARFTHDPFSIIAASRNDYDHGIRYLSLHDNRYMRFFKGHTDRVVALEMSPKEDTFASASADDTVRLWDLRTTDCTGVIRFAGGRRAAIAFDLQGMVFAASGGGGQTKMYDVRAYDKGPFATFTPDMGGPIDFSSVKFSHDGKLMLLGTTQGTVPRHVESSRPEASATSATSPSSSPRQRQNELRAAFSLGQPRPVGRCVPGWPAIPALFRTQVLLLDAFTGGLVRTFSGHDNTRQLPLEACFGPDAEYVLSGSEDGTIWRWRTATGEALPPLQGHSGPVGALKVNPTRMLLASACSALCLWLPQQQQQQPTGMMG